MISGDYKERTRKNKKGKEITEKIIKTASGNEYIIGKRMGQGGVGRVYKVRRVSDGKEFAFKEYMPSPDRAAIHKGIKKNLQTLLRNPILDRDGIPLKSFIGPIELVDLPASRGFGYIMELVDTENYVPLKKLWHSASIYPDALILCKICKNIAHLFTRLHLGTGWCYKDINEGNIYINPKTGDIFVIDLDNISVPKTKTILGTHGYMAPEVYVTNEPDTRTDQFSMAVYFYRLLIGGYPLEGKKTMEYLKKNNKAVQEAGDVIYGSMALFAFDPKDTSNSIQPLVKEKDGEVYQAQINLWNDLPEEIQQCFIRTFSTGLHNREMRATDGMWYKAFDDVEKNGLVKCKCGKHNFGSRTKQKACKFCSKKLPMLPPKKVAAKSTSILPTKKKELTTVVFRARRDVEPSKLRVEAMRKAELSGRVVHPSLPQSNLMRIEYSQKKNLLSAVNMSNITWSVSCDGVKDVCPPGKRVILKEDLVITVLRRQLELKVLEIK